MGHFDVQNLYYHESLTRETEHINYSNIDLHIGLNLFLHYSPPLSVDLFAHRLESTESGKIANVLFRIC